MFRPRFWFWAYRRSPCVFDLCNHLNGRVIKHVNSNYQQRPEDIVINWGSTNCPFEGALNDPQAVSVATSKTATFARLHEAGVAIPPFTTSHAVAQSWTERGRVFGRDLDRGSQGRGITVYDRHSEIGQHRFYTRAMRADREIRCHIFRGQPIFYQEKLRKRNVEYDPFIRSHLRGWVFAFNHLPANPIPDSVGEVSRQAVAALGLDFGAVDVLWNNNKNVATVLEVNTAPGLENTSLQAYVTAFKELGRPIMD